MHSNLKYHQLMNKRRKILLINTNHLTRKLSRKNKFGKMKIIFINKRIYQGEKKCQNH